MLTDVKPRQGRLTEKPRSGTSTYPAIDVKFAGITTYDFKLSVSDFLNLLSRQLDLTSKKKSTTPAAPRDLKERLAEAMSDEDGNESVEQDLIDDLLGMVNRSRTNKQRKDNLQKLEDYLKMGYVSSRESHLVVLPQFALWTPSAVFFDESTNSLHLNLFQTVMVILDGQTRGTAIKSLYETYKKELKHDELSIKLISGVSIDSATQCFVDWNSTAVPVEFDDYFAKDTRRPVFELAADLYQEKLPHLKTRTVLQMCQQAFKGPGAETKNALPELFREEEEIPDDNKDDWALLSVARERMELIVDELNRIDSAADEKGPTSLIHTGYGPMAIARVFFECGRAAREIPTQKDPEKMRTVYDDLSYEVQRDNFVRTMRERVARIDWRRSNSKLLAKGYSKKGKKDGYVNNVTSYRTVRELAADILSDSWTELLED